MEDKASAGQEIEQVPILINGKTYHAPRGENLLHFMIKSRFDISYFCYHPDLSVVAVCRQCLVELKGAPKLVPACQTYIQPNMEIISNSERVLTARQQLLEFTLLNHPVDCPICDKAGECTLQRHYMDWDASPSRSETPKVRKPKRVDLGPRIILDAERCILCTRCVRFSDEIAQSPQLCISHRGSHSELCTPPGHQLDHPYSLNTVDICPVGALTDKEFRFKQRVWDLKSTLSICTGCATGCPIEIHHHKNKIYRLVPRKHFDMNLNWMCDEGRDLFKSLDHHRIAYPQMDGREVAWDVALDRLKSRIAPILVQAPKSLGFILSAEISNEDAFVAIDLAKTGIQTENIYLASAPNWPFDQILRSPDANPNRAGISSLAEHKFKTPEDLCRDLSDGKLKALFVIGDRLSLPVEAWTQAKKLELLVVQASCSNEASRHASIILPACAWTEIDATIQNANGVVQRLRKATSPPGDAKPHWMLLCLIAHHLNISLELGQPDMSARNLFEQMKKQISSFEGAAEWGPDLPPRLLRFAGSRG